jgi:predicted dehydrogenase
VNPFRVVPGRPLQVIVAGAGPMGRAWLATVKRSPDVRLAGLVDLDPDAAHRALAETGSGDVPVGTSVSEVHRAAGADAVINVTVPAAHHAVTTEALVAGLPVLTEKPIAPTVAEGLSLAATAEWAGELLMVSQSRRYYRTLRQFRSLVPALGDIGLVTTEFFKAPHFGGFRDEMASPLLVDMAIHAFDCYRYVFGDEPVSVYCEEFNPPWSWYRGNAAASATFETRSGARYVFTGSWCSPGLETSWNGHWRVSGSAGSATWNGQDAPVWESDPPATGTDPGPVPEEIAGALADFVHALRTGEPPLAVAPRNIRSLAMVEAAVLSAAKGVRVRLDDVIRQAYDDALAAETRPQVADLLRRWSAASPV